MPVRRRRAGDQQDMGYCWVVLASSSLLNTMTSGCFSSFSVFFPEYVAYFRVSKAEAAVVGSITIGIWGLTGVILGPLVAFIGYRRLILSGCVLVTVGLSVSSFVDSLYLLYFTQGFLPGLGFACYVIGGFVSTMEYFDKKKALAFGIHMAGHSVGDFVMPQIVTFLIEKYTWKGALLIFGGIQMQGFILGALMRPFRKVDNNRTLDEHVDENRNEHQVDSTSFRRRGPKSKITCKLTTFFDYTILTDKKSILFFLSMAIMFQGYLIPYTFLPARAIANGTDFMRAALLVSIVGACSGLCRPVIGLLGDRVKNHRTLIVATSGLVTGAATAISYPLKHYTITAVLFGFIGCFGAGFISVYGAIIGDVVPADKSAQATGLIQTFFGVASLIVAPVGGYLIDVTGDYATPFLVFGVTMMAGSLLSFTLYYLQQRDRRRRDSGCQGQIGAEGPHGQMDTERTLGQMDTEMKVLETRKPIEIQRD